MKTRRRFPERFKWRMNDRLPGQTLKRKRWIFASIVLICAVFDVLLLFIANNAISPLLEDAPHLPEKYAQAYTHLATFRQDLHPEWNETIKTIAFSPDGQILAAGQSREVRLWDVRTGNLITVHEEHQGWIQAVAFSPNGKTVACVSSNGGSNSWPVVILLDPLAPRYLVTHTIRLWDAKTSTTQLTFSANTLPITALEFSSDSTKLLIANQQGFIGVYDSAIGHQEQFSRAPFVHDAIRNTYGFNALAFSPDGKTLVTGGRNSGYRGLDRGLYDIADAEIQLWDTNTGHLLHTFNSPGRWIDLLVFSPDGKTLASVGEDWDWCTKIFIWDLENRRLLSIINTGKRRIKTLKFAPDSTTLASGHTDGSIHLWDITGQTKSE
ncbi:WD40 repeat domain-containing protein [Candidatus Poribacteria bacterium]|nr:WD40 repeat domain-containing protein [Candidatus Poribacteria bacterium]MYK22309.1 WD40 repeat domain-containing protein [Candidatus Poribacteria bacterium]